MPTILGASRKQAGRYYDKGGRAINALHPDFGIKADGSDDLVGITALVAAAVAINAPVTIEWPTVKYDVAGNASPAIYGLSAIVQIRSKYKINFRMLGSVAEDSPYGSFFQPLANFPTYMFEWKTPVGLTRSEAGGGDIIGVAASDRSNTGAATTKTKRQWTMQAAFGLTDWHWSKLEHGHFTYLKGSAWRTDFSVMSSAHANIVRLCGNAGAPAIDLNATSSSFATQSFVLNGNKVEVNYDAAYVNINAFCSDIKVTENGMETGFVLNHTGTGTVTSSAGATTFSTSQAGVLANGSIVTVAGVNYTLSAFNGTTGGTLSGAPTFGASSFTYLSQNESDDNTSSQSYVVCSGFDSHIALNHFNRNGATTVFVDGQNNIVTANVFASHYGLSYFCSNIGNVLSGNEFHACPGSTIANNAGVIVRLTGTSQAAKTNTFYFSGGIDTAGNGHSVNDITFYVPNQTIGLAYIIDWLSGSGGNCNTNNIYFNPVSTTTGGIRLTAAPIACGLNTIVKALVGIYVDNSLHTVASNVLSGCTTPMSGITNFQRSSYIRANSGFVSENQGQATVAAGSTSVTVTHGMSFTPRSEDVRLTEFNNMGAATKKWISAPTSTQFTITVDVAPGGSGAIFGWQIQGT